jgi:hypothetical protein
MGSWAAYEIGNLRASLAKREAELAAANLTIAELRRDARGDALGQAQSWRAVFTLARSLGMELGNGATTGQQDVLLFIRGLSDKLHAADSARATAEGECERLKAVIGELLYVASNTSCEYWERGCAIREPQRQDEWCRRCSAIRVGRAALGDS